MITIQDLNELSLAELIERLKDICEHSPWVVERAGQLRPFVSKEDVYAKLVSAVETASLDEKLSLIQAHPHLGARKRMSSFSESEQKHAGLNQLAETEYELLLQMNKKYVEQFGFPFILAVRGKNKEDILQTMKTRLRYSKEQEFKQALSEIYQIIRFRIEDQIT